jgi:hypothetical protein
LGNGVNFTAYLRSVDANGDPTDKINLKIELYYYLNIRLDIIFIEITAVSKVLSIVYQKVCKNTTITLNKTSYGHHGVFSYLLDICSMQEVAFKLFHC